MKKRRIKFLYALLTLTVALLIALTGTLVPQLLLETKAGRLAAGTGTVENGDVSPYTYTMDTETRIPKLAALTEQMNVFGEDRYLNIREPLDTEVSAEQAKKKVIKFVEVYASRLEELGITLSMADMSYANGVAANVQTDDGWPTDSGENFDGAPTVDADAEFLVSPDDQQLSLWFCYAHLGSCDLQIAVDAVAGIPVVINYNTVGVSVEESWCEALADTYTKLYGENFQFTYPEVLDEVHIGQNMVSAGAASWYGFGCETEDQALHLEMQCYYDGQQAKLADTYFDVYVWLY